MVDYDVRDLEDLVMECEDSDLEDVLLLAYQDRGAELAEAAFRRSQRDFNFEELPEHDFKKRFRFHKKDIPELCEALGIPDEINSPNRLSWSGIEGLCILLRRLSYPGRMYDLEEMFCRGESSITVIVNCMLSCLHDRWSGLLSNLVENVGPGKWLSRDRLLEAAEAVHGKCPIPNCWGFIDGTGRPIARHTRGQRIWYSGHKRMHMQKFQGVTTPFGIVVHLFGPVEGSRHDAAMLRMSGLLDQIEAHLPARGPDAGDVFTLYGDSAYPLRQHLQAPFAGANLTPPQRQYNSQMSECRIAIEWAFAEVAAKFAYVDLKKAQRLLHGSIGTFYRVAVLLTNCHTCLYANETSSYFGLKPPTLQEYLQ